MAQLMLLVIFLGIVNAAPDKYNRGHALVRDQHNSGLLYWLYTEYNPPRNQLKATIKIGLPLSGDTSKDKWTVMLGEPDQFARTFIFTASTFGSQTNGFFEWSDASGQLTWIDAPFTFSQPLCGCRNHVNLDYYILFWDTSNTLALWKFQPPTLPNQGYTFTKQSVNLRRDFNLQTFTTDKCAFNNGNITFGASRDGFFNGLINVNPTTGASTFIDTKFSTVTAVGNYPINTSPMGILTDLNGPSTYADFRPPVAFNFEQAIPTVMDKRIPTFADITSGALFYPASPQGPLVSVRQVGFNGKVFLDINPYWISAGWQNATIIALSN